MKSSSTIDGGNGVSTFQEYMSEYKKQLQKGLIQKAYGGLMDYVMILRTHLQHKYPDYFVSAIYYGYMDMTYFSFTSRMLQEMKLKILELMVTKHEAQINKKKK